MSEIKVRFAAIELRILAACERSKRERSSVRCIAVSKRQPIEKILALYDLGVRDFGESYAQELRDKREKLPKDIRWHFIGGLQSNKLPYLDQIELLHSCDRSSLIKKISKRVKKKNLSPQKILLQVNLAAEKQKSGCRMHEVEDLLRLALQSEGVYPIGLMNITPNYNDPKKAREHFKVLFSLLTRLRKQFAETFLQCSMGMSNDLEAAIEEGSTMIRVGTALFGTRI